MNSKHEAARAMLAGAALAFMAVAMSAPARAQERVKAGVLSCDISGGIGFIIGSHKEVTCLFTPSTPGPQEVYIGAIRKFGLDIGATGGGQMIWEVFAPTDRRFGGLNGDYVGATGEASVGAGVGANVLIGGSDRTVSLQPLSIQGQVGLNLAVGVADLVLRQSR